MKIIHLSILILFVSLGMTTRGYSQFKKKVQKEKFDCTSLKKLLQDAELHYLDGDFSKAIKILTDGNKLDKVKRCSDTKRDVFNLLAKLNLLTNEDENANNYIRNSLKIDPSYKLNPELEPTDFLYFVDRYRAVPLFSITPEVSLLTTDPFNRDVYTVSAVGADNSDIELSSVKYIPLQSPGIGLRGSVHLNRLIEFSGGVSYNQKLFEIEQKQINPTRVYLNSGQSPTLIDPANEFLTIREEQRWISIPLMLKLNFGSDKLQFNFFGGYEPQWLLSAHFNRARRGGFDLIEQINSLDGNKPGSDLNELQRQIGLAYLFSQGNTIFDIIENEIPIPIDESIEFYYGEDVDPADLYTADNFFNVTTLRYTYNPAWIVGAGLKYRPPGSKRHYLTFNFQYGRYRYNINESFASYPIDYEKEGVFQDSANNIELKENLLFALGYLDSPFKLHYMQYSIGYSFHIYRVKEKNKL